MQIKIKQIENMTNIVGGNASATTSDDVLKVLASIAIDGDDCTHMIELYVNAYSSPTVLGAWKRTIVVSKSSGTTAIAYENADADKQIGGLDAIRCEHEQQC